jgi:hypothetical protein
VLELLFMKDATTRSLFMYLETPYIPDGLYIKQSRKIKPGTPRRLSGRALERVAWSSTEMGRGVAGPFFLLLG